MQKVDINHHLFKKSSLIRVRSVELKADDDLQTHREKLAKILLDDMYQFVGLLDAEGILLEVNRAALEGAGILMEEIQGKPFWEARWWQVSEEIRNKQKEAVQRAAAGEFVRYDEEIYGQGSGEGTIIIDYSLNPVTDTSGKVVFLLAEGRNITEKKLAEAEIARKSQELQNLFQKIKELDEIKSQFFANVSHELRTPLALILGPAEKILEEGDYLNPLHRRDLNVIRKNAATLLKHVNDLLDISKLDAGKMLPQYSEVNLSRLIRLTAAHFDALAPQREIKFLVEAPESLDAQVDPDKIERVMLNLLSNAFKFTPSKGRIKVSLNTDPEGENALITVQDSGPGVKEEFKKLIFERFRQAEGGTTRAFGGTGLGLSIAKDFIDLHNGVLSVADAPGGGALFQIKLPLFAPPESRVKKSSYESSVEGHSVLKGVIAELSPSGPTPSVKKEGENGETNRPKVLVVEDNLEMNRFIVESLSHEFEVFSAFNGEEGLKRARELRPDLILTDIMMPKMGGDDLVKEVRKDKTLDLMPIIILSAKEDDKLRVNLLRSGAQDFVTKPFSGEEVIARSRNLIELKHARELLQERAKGSSDALAFHRDVTNIITDNAASCLFMMDKKGHPTFMNPAAKEVTGYESLDEIKHRPLHYAVHWKKPDGSHYPMEECPIDNAQAELTAVKNKEEIFCKKDGTLFPVSYSVAPLEVGGEVVGSVLEFRDITDQKRSEEALKAAVRARDEFLSIASHELKTPLTSLSLQTQTMKRSILKEDPTVYTKPRVDRLVDQNEKHVHRLTRLVDDMLDIARMRTGNLTMDPKEFNFYELIEEVAERVRPHFAEAGVA